MIPRSMASSLRATAAAVVLAQLPAADLVLINGRVYTADRARPWAEAIAIGGARITAVGSYG